MNSFRSDAYAWGAFDSPEVVFVLGDVIEVVQCFSHATELIVQHVVPVLLALCLSDIVHVLDKVSCHACDYFQRQVAASEQVLIQQPCHELVNLQLCQN